MSIDTRSVYGGLCPDSVPHEDATRPMNSFNVEYIKTKFDMLGAVVLEFRRGRKEKLILTARKEIAVEFAEAVSRTAAEVWREQNPDYQSLLPESLPEDWNPFLAEDWNPFRAAKQDESAEMLTCLKDLVESTFLRKRTRDRRGTTPVSLEVVAAKKVFNLANWIAYVKEWERIRGNRSREGAKQDEPLELAWMEPDVLTTKLPHPELGALDDEVGERWLFHGTGGAGLVGITDDDFCLDLSGSNAGELFGKGVYLAESCAKADEYSRNKAPRSADEVLNEHRDWYGMLVCRTCLGRVLVHAEQ